MSALRRYSPFIAAIVLACVGAQTLDLGLCCSPPAPSPSETEAIVSVTGAGSLLSAAALPPALGDAAPGEERSSSSHAAQPDCLCDLVFTSSLVPPLLAAAAPTSLVAEAPELPRSALLLPPGQVPIA